MSEANTESDAAVTAMNIGAMDIQQVMAAIPHRYPMLLVDRVEEIVPGESIIAVKGVTMNEHFFQGHFPGRPIMPGVMIIEAMAQTAAIMAVTELNLLDSGKLVYFMAIDGAKFRSPVEPGCLLTFKVKYTRKRFPVCKFAGEAWIGDRLAASCDFTAMIADPPES